MTSKIPNQYMTFKKSHKCNDKIYLSFPNTVSREWSEQKESFLSLYAAVRRPFSPAYYDPNYVQPSFPGVN